MKKLPLFIVYIILISIDIGICYWIKTKGFIQDWKDVIGIGAIFATFVTSFMSILISVSISKDVEILKASLTQKIQAYHDLYSAALNFYQKMKSLEEGEFKPLDMEKCEKRMEEVMVMLQYVDSGYEKHWYALWQEFRRTKEIINKEIVGKNKKDKEMYLRNIWNEKVGWFGEKLDTLKNISRRQF